MQENDYMKRAIELAKKGRGKVNPNPLVGAVIVKNGQIIGEGYHMKYGELHAERQAFANLTASAQGAQMYVTLEPCCHYGKQPPCTEAIIEHGIKKVYVGSDDPNKLVAGKGIKILQDAGIEVVTHFMKEECDKINQVFFHYIVNKTPYVVMKYAMTADGKIACENGESKWITGELARNQVQEFRNEYTAIMVGVNTVINDNPMLTCRIENGRNPIRIVCDSNLRIPLDSNLVGTANEIPTIVATVSADNEKKELLEKKGVKIIVTNNKNGKVDLNELMHKLGENNIDSVLLEGGGVLNSSALSAGIVKHIKAYIAPKILGGSGKYSPVTGVGVTNPNEAAYSLSNKSISVVGEDILLEYIIK